MKKTVFLASVGATAVVGGASTLFTDANAFGAVHHAYGSQTADLPGSVPPAPMPESATMLLFGLGLLCFAAVTRHRTSRK